MSGEAEKSTLDKWLARKKEGNAVGIAKKPEDRPSALSYGQERLWLLEQLYPNQNLYSYGHRYQIRGSVDIENLIRSFQLLVEKHEILRSTYNEQDGLVVQEVLTSFELPVTHISNGSNTDQQIERVLQTPFDLTKDLPIRLFINQIDSSKTELILVLHHIAGDAWSMNIVNKDISKNYLQLISAKPVDENKQGLQYKDYAFWQRTQQVKEDDLNYWKSKLKGETGTVKLPLPQTKDASFKGKWLRRKLPVKLTTQIKANAKDANVTFNSYWLATFKLFLAKYSNQTSLTVGSPFSNRDKKDLEALIGFFNETLVLKSNFDGDPDFSSIVSQVNETVLEALSHKNVPFEKLVNELSPDRAVGENPLFATMFLYNNTPTRLAIPDLEIQEETIDMGVSKFDLTLFVNEHTDGVELIFEHTMRFDDSVIESMMNHYEVLLHNIAKNPTAKISELSVLSQSEENQITQSWNNTEVSIPEAGSIIELISQHEKSSPDSIAVRFNDQSLTYKQLSSWSNAIAKDLISRGTKTGEFVGIHTHRSIEMIVAIIGVLKAGAAYLPLDPQYPQQRLNYMLKDAESRFLLVSSDMENLSFDADQILIKRSENIDFTPILINPSNYAYIIYTSGSTGQPKGVAVSHRNLLQSTAARYTFYEEEMNSFLLLSSFSFDSSIAGIFWSLSSGGTLILPPERIEQDISLLTATIQKNRVTHTLMLPSLYQVLLNYADLATLKSLTTVIVAGEAVSQKLRKEHFVRLPSARLYNEYGPTEATVWCVAHEIKSTEEGTIPIGKPVPNAKALVLDRHLSPVPPEAEGELCIGGNSVTDGYWKNSELTDKKFQPNPFAEGRIYHTGDIAKWRYDGTLDFIGREDSQIKIRGHRVEIEEIKYCFQQIDSVKEVEIRIEGEEKKSIYAYLLNEYEIPEFELLDRAKSMLPEHMVPSTILVLKVFPRLPNGKVDLTKLPLPDRSKVVAHEEPTSALEKQLIRIWKDVLNVNTISIHDNFFDIGGDSIQSIQVIAKAKKEGIVIAPTAIFQSQTVAKLSASIADKIQDQDNWSAVIPLKVSGGAPPLFCIHSGGAHVMFYRDFAHAIGKEHPVYAIQPRGLDNDQDYHKSIAEMAKHYIEGIKKVQPSGPYHLLTTCFSNAVGLDMIHQLRKQGDDVAIMYVVDSAPAFLIPPSPNGERKPVRRMARMIWEGNLSGIYKKIRNRLILAGRKIKASQTSDVQKDLYEMIHSLNHLYSTYTWKPIDAHVLLIRSSEFANRKGKQFHLDHWNLLSQENLEVYQVDGHHKTLFQKPEVFGLAQEISRHKSQLQKKVSHEAR